MVRAQDLPGGRRGKQGHYSGPKSLSCHLCSSEPLSSVSSLEVHFDLLDLTELTDMSDQELAEVFADSDDENVASESPAGECAQPGGGQPGLPPTHWDNSTHLGPGPCPSQLGGRGSTR